MVFKHSCESSKCQRGQLFMHHLSHWHLNQKLLSSLSQYQNRFGACRSCLVVCEISFGLTSLCILAFEGCFRSIYG